MLGFFCALFLIKKCTFSVFSISDTKSAQLANIR